MLADTEVLNYVAGARLILATKRQMASLNVVFTALLQEELHQRLHGEKVHNATETAKEAIGRKEGFLVLNV